MVLQLGLQLLLFLELQLQKVLLEDVLVGRTTLADCARFRHL